MKLSFTGYGRQFDIELNYRVTLVRGKSGVGKTVLYDMLKTVVQLEEMRYSVITWRHREYLKRHSSNGKQV